MQLLSEIGKVPSGRQILVTKQIAVLNQLQRQRPDWVSNRALIDQIASLTASNKESLLELALDLDLSAKQLIDYLATVERLNGLPPSPARNFANRSFQATTELLRELSTKSALPPTRLAEVVDKFFALDPTSADYGLKLIPFLRTDLLNVNDGLPGEEIECRLIDLLVAQPPVEIPAFNQKEPANPKGTTEEATVLASGTMGRARVDTFLGSQTHTRLAAVLDAITALNALEHQPTSNEAVSQLNAAIAKFVEAVPPADSKKKKSN